MALSAQKNLGKSRQVLMDHLQQFIKNSPSSKLEFDKQNERLVMSTRDSSGQSIRYEYGFDDKSGACFTEMTVSTCETCEQAANRNILSMEKDKRESVCFAVWRLPAHWVAANRYWILVYPDKDSLDPGALQYDERELK